MSSQLSLTIGAKTITAVKRLKHYIINRLGKYCFISRCIYVENGSDRHFLHCYGQLNRAKENISFPVNASLVPQVLV